MFLCRIQLNHPYTHKRHRSLSARASRRKSAPLVTSSETRRPTGFGENDSENPPSILIVVLVSGVKGPSRQRAPEQTPRGRSSCRSFARERPDGRARASWKSKCAASRGCSNTCRSVPSKHNTRIIRRRTCSVKFILRFEDRRRRLWASCWMVSRKGRYLREICVLCVYARDDGAGTTRGGCLFSQRMGYSQSFRTVIDRDRRIHLRGPWL